MFAIYEIFQIAEMQQFSRQFQFCFVTPISPMHTHHHYSGQWAASTSTLHSCYPNFFSSSVSVKLWALLPVLAPVLNTSALVAQEHMLLTAYWASSSSLSFTVLWILKYLIAPLNYALPILLLILTA